MPEFSFHYGLVYLYSSPRGQALVFLGSVADYWALGEIYFPLTSFDVDVPACLRDREALRGLRTALSTGVV